MADVADKYAVLAAGLSQYEWFNSPLPALLGSASGAIAGMLPTLRHSADWSQLASMAKSALKHEDGTVDWGKVAAASILGAAAISGALDAMTDGKFNEQVSELGGAALKWLGGLTKKDET